MATEPQNTKPFYNTEIPEDWVVKELNQLIKSISNGVTYDPDSKNGFPITRIETIADGTVNSNKVGLTPFKTSFEKFKLKKGDILYSHINSVSQIGKTAYCAEDYDILHGMNLLLLKPNHDVESKYLFYLLNSKYGRKPAYSAAKRAVNQASLSTTEIKQFKFPLPPLPEQRAIARVLSTADAAIHTTEKLIAQKELRKKWLMQQLLTGKKRLKGFESTKWKIQPLECFIKPIVRQVPKPSVPYLGIGLRSHGKGTFLKHNEQPEKNSMDNFYVVRPNDLIVNITFAWEQAIAIVRPEDDGALASHRFPTFTFIEDKGHPDFFKFYILQPRVKFMLQMISPGGAGRNRVMSKSDFIKLEFLLPDYKEQTAIARVLQAADKEISLLKAKAEKLREQKKGLMQVLLTGKKRLKINESNNETN
jgi:type I restriction enzyme, S subunit